jgi:hypothetical protein
MEAIRKPKLRSFQGTRSLQAIQFDKYCLTHDILHDMEGDEALGLKE